MLAKAILSRKRESSGVLSGGPLSHRSAEGASAELTTPRSGAASFRDPTLMSLFAEAPALVGTGAERR